MIIIIIRGSIASCWRIDFGVRADGYAVRTATASRTVCEWGRYANRHGTVTASLSTPSTYFLSKPFTFTLTFSTDATHSITVLAARERPVSEYTDVKILDATSRRQVFPNLIVCCDDDGPGRKKLFEPRRRIRGA
jgi:hypothetical protein